MKDMKYERFRGEALIDNEQEMCEDAMIFPTYYVKEMYVGFNDSPNILCQRNVCRVQ